MAPGTEPLLPKAKATPKRQKLSVLYGADEYLEELKKKYEVDHEIASLKAIMPDQGDDRAGKANKEGEGKMMKIEKTTRTAARRLAASSPLPISPTRCPRSSRSSSPASRRSRRCTCGTSSR
jgi:hypothetical protein